MADNAYQKIKDTDSLPSPNGVAQEILRLASDDMATMKSLADVVEQDPATAARLLKYVNSPLAGLSKQVASVRKAVVMLGVQTVKSIAMGFSLVSQTRSGPCHGFDYPGFWTESVARGVAARHIAHRCRILAADEAFTCGLLCQIGRLAFSTVYPDTYSYALKQVADSDGAHLLDVEREIFDLDHNELAAEMMTDWNLPAVLCDAVRHQDSVESGPPTGETQRDRLARLLHLAGGIADVFTGARVYKASLSALVSEAYRFGIQPELFAQTFDSTGEEWPGMGAIFNVPTRPVSPWAEIHTWAH